jgi:hypothetical protein
MRRSLLVTFSLLLAVVGLTPAAQADSTTVIHGLDFPVDGSAGLITSTCASPWIHPSFGSGGPTIAATDDPTNPLGTSKFGWNFDGGTTFAIGPYGFDATPGAAGTHDIRLNVTTGVTHGFAIVFFFSNDDHNTGNYWVGTAPVMKSVNGWYTVDAESLVMDWHHWNFGLSTFDNTVTGQTRTTFVGGHGGDGDGAFEGFTFGCGDDFYVDRLRVGPTGSVTTYDYERALTKTTASASPSTITAGGATTLKGVMTGTDGTPFSSATLTLEARPYGAASYSVVGGGTETNNGTQVPATSVQHPTKQTSYRWHFAGSSSGTESYSSSITVSVHTRISIALKSARVKKNRSLIVTGTTYPHKAGYRVTLQRKIGSTWRTWTYVRTTSAGSYRIAKKMTSTGRWQIRVIVAAGGGNLNGTSAVKRLTVYR